MSTPSRRPSRLARTACVLGLALVVSTVGLAASRSTSAQTPAAVPSSAAPPVAPGAPGAPASSGTKPGDQDPALAKLVEALAGQGVHLDPASGAFWIPARVEIRDELLEYLLVGPAGATHESLFSTPVRPSVLNTALLALGMQPGRNAVWRPRDPKPSEEELRAGVTPYVVDLPQGDSVELRVAWRQEEELYFFRVEDLLRNLLTGASMQRHRWVFLGSQMLPPDPRKAASSKDPLQSAGEQFAADVYQNLINIAYFSEGYTVVTAALPECVEQTIWLPNAWLIPQRGAEVALFFSRGSLREIPASLAAGLPTIASEARDARRAENSASPGAPTGTTPGTPPKGGR